MIGLSPWQDLQVLWEGLPNPLEMKILQFACPELLACDLH
jgi:hypothetical protein